MSNKRLAVYGTGGFAREIAPLVVHELDTVFVDDAADAPQTVMGLSVLNFAALTSAEHHDRQIVIAIGDGRIRQLIEDRCVSAGLQIGSVVAPSARIVGKNEIGSGVVLCDFTTVTSDARIGKNFQANIYSYVAHDCVIGDYVTFAPRVSCNGTVHIGDFAYLGTGASLIQGTHESPLSIGEGAIVAMGAVVTKPVAPYTLVAGNPARLVRELNRP